ncbi:MAG: VWA domain-containing protein [Syntrophobacteraceae bacterium]
MSSIRFENPEMLQLLWLVPVLLCIAFYRFKKKDQALAGFAETALLERLNRTVSRARQWWKVVLVAAGSCLIVISLARPAWNPRPEKVEAKGRDIVFVLDVSRSMMAEDLKPNRLERAKLAMRDLVDKLEGDRVALVAFAGTSIVKCPLTLDYGFFRLMLDDTGPENMSRGGTLIGDALRKTVDEIYSDRLKCFKDIILITDGEDQDSFPVEAAKEAGERGIRLIAIGLGDEGEGQRIPVLNDKGERSFLRHGGREVWTRLDADTLRKMAASTPGGKYLNVATGTFDLGAIYRDLMVDEEKRSLESMKINRYEEKFQIFLGAAILFILAEMAISERKKVNGS